MKQLKFLTTVFLEGKPIWYKDCSYEVVKESDSPDGRPMYRLFCEDLQLRGIDTVLANKFFKVIELPDIKKEEKAEEIVENKKEEIKKEEKKEIKSTSAKPKQNYNKKKKSHK